MIEVEEEEAKRTRWWVF